MMKPIAALLAAVFAGALVPVSGSASDPVHVVTGGGLVSYADKMNIHSFAAQIEEDGEVRGKAEFAFRYLGVEFEADIECLAVVDNDAWLGGTISSASDTSLVGQAIMFRVQDNGEGDDAEDMTSQIMIGVTVPECSATPPLGLMTWAHGDVRIR